jgi:hypothetical protein
MRALMSTRAPADKRDLHWACRSLLPFAVFSSSGTAGVDPVSGAYFSATNPAYIAAASAGVCSTPYFSSVFLNCDWQDGLGQPFVGGEVSFEPPFTSLDHLVGARPNARKSRAGPVHTTSSE